ncbi:MAG: glycine cleavage T C-terminal barrel domain-containing protein, partial [Pseudomonadota bacterium]
EPERDVTAMDVARFPSWLSPGFTLPKVVENYQRRFSISYPNEELPAGRPLRQSAMFYIFDNIGAVWGQQFGLEVPNYFATGDEPRFETPSFRRSNAWEATRREVMAVRDSVGINETHNFGKYRVSGENAEAWLARVMAGRIPKVGRLALSPMLSPKGKLLGDFTISRVSEDAFHLTASYGAQDIHMRWFDENAMPGCRVENVSDTLTGFQIAGPNAANVLQKATRADVSTLRFLDVRRMVIGMVSCWVQRVSYTGDLGFEIYAHPMEQRHLWRELWAAGQDYGMKPFGMRAMMSLRLDKFFGSWLSEYSPDYTAAETGLARFIDFSRDFIGSDAARRDKPTRTLCAFEVATQEADVMGYEPIYAGRDVVGFCTSGGYSHFAQKSIALGFLPNALAQADQDVEIEILGQLCAARRLNSPLFDADGERMRQS